ncbi:MAG TPA: FHA domain-containing protein, partial [Candidatus Polarisedimenticolia bacterium]|nr:FHA domain-containing protein [Candidatus Polarisedimenticolia bacterium]
MGTLVISLGSLPVLALKVGADQIKLGRDPANDVVLPLPEVGDFHAILIPSREGALIQASKGEALLVNGKVVEAAALSSSDTTLLGGYRLRWLDAQYLPGAAPEDTGLAGSESHATSPVEQEVPAAGESTTGVVARVLVTLGRDAGL